MGQIFSPQRYDASPHLPRESRIRWPIGAEIEALPEEAHTLAETAPDPEAEAVAKTEEVVGDIVPLYEEDPFPALPDELLALILQKCEPEAYLAAWQVNHRWRAVASQVSISFRTRVFLPISFKKIASQWLPWRFTSVGLDAVPISPEPGWILFSKCPVATV